MSSALVGLLVLAVFQAAAPAQLVYQFKQSGANTVVTGSGSVTSADLLDPNLSGAPLIGYISGNQLEIEALAQINPAVPGGWVSPAVDVATQEFAIPLSSDLVLLGGANPINMGGLAYRTGAGSYFFFITDAGIPQLTLLSASGTAIFSDLALSSLFEIYEPGSVIDVYPGFVQFIIGCPEGEHVAPSPLALAPVSGGTSQAPTILVSDVGAIYSARTSGLAMGMIHQQVILGAADPALRDLNTRLFRVRAEQGSRPGETKAAAGASSSLLRYLDFVRDENMSYKVAFGLADAHERDIVVDTLRGRRVLGGGLAYAMMGVPNMTGEARDATVRIVEAAGADKVVIDDSKVVIENQVSERWELFVAGDFSVYDQNQLSNLMESFETETFAGSVGLEYRAKDWLNLGLAWSYLGSDTQIAGDLGGIDLEGDLISAYATAYWRQYWMDLLYSYGSFDSDIRRNTGLGTTARGSTYSDSHRIRLNAGWNYQVSENTVTGPVIGLLYAKGNLDAYSESGGGAAALQYRGSGFESMVSRLGWQASHHKETRLGSIVTQIRGAWQHEFIPENSTVGVSLLTSPFALVSGNQVSRVGGYSTEGDGPYTGTDWLSAGAGVRFEWDKGWALLFDYEGVFFRSDVGQHFGSVKVSYEW